MPLNINVATTFNLLTNKVSVADLTTYLSQGVDPSIITVKGLIVMTAPSGIAFVSATDLNSPPINVSASDTVSPDYNLPLVATDVMNGQYSLTYTSNLSYSNTSASILDANDIVIPGVDLTSVYGVGDSVTISGSEHAGNNGVKTILSVTFDSTNTIIVVTTSLTQDIETCTVSFSKNVVFTDTYTYSNCLLPTANLEAAYDCQSTQFGSITITDNTNYGSWSVVDKTIEAYYPNGLNPEPITNPVIANDVNVLFVPQLATGTWTTVLNTVLTQTLTSGLIVTDELKSVNEVYVSCKGTLCDLTECINQLYIKHKAALGCGTSSPYTPYVDAIALLYPLAKEAKACGNYTEFNHYYDEMQATLSASGVECNCGCCNGDNAPSWIDNSTFDAESILTQLQLEIDTINTSITNINTSLDTINSDVTAIQADVNQLQSDVNQLQSDVVALQSAVAQIELQQPGVYWSLVTQNSKSAPVVELNPINTAGMNYSNITRLSAGIYLFSDPSSPVGAFVFMPPASGMFVSYGDSENGTYNYTVGSNGDITLYTYNSSGVLSDGIIASGVQIYFQRYNVV